MTLCSTEEYLSRCTTRRYREAPEQTFRHSFKRFIGTADDINMCLQSSESSGHPREKFRSAQNCLFYSYIYFCLTVCQNFSQSHSTLLFVFASVPCVDTNITLILYFPVIFSLSSFVCLVQAKCI